MNQNQINKLLSLMRRTGDRAIVADNESDGLFVIMDSGDYERFLNHSKSVKGLSEQEMMTRINRDISLWQSQNDLRDNKTIFGGAVKKNNLATAEDFFEEYWNNSPIDQAQFTEGINAEGANSEEEPDEIPFDELERDGFVVTGEEEKAGHREDEELLYLERVDNEPLPLGDSGSFEEINIKDRETNKDKENSISKANSVFEEALDDVIEEGEEDKFLDEPIE